MCCFTIVATTTNTCLLIYRKSTKMMPTRMDKVAMVTTFPLLRQTKTVSLLCAVLFTRVVLSVT